MTGFPPVRTYAISRPHLRLHKTDYAQDLIDRFSLVGSMPQIAVSVDMLDTGIDVPEVVNLVFFKKVRSKAKFWQMIGRGTRLCPDLFGPGLDKESFLIFDFCGNFEFFRATPHGKEVKGTMGLTERIFNTKLELIYELQHLDYQEEKYDQYRETLVSDLVEEIKSLNTESFVVKQKLWYVEKYRTESQWQSLTVVEVEEIKENLGPLIPPAADEEMAKRFDNLMYTLQLALVLGKSITKGKNEVIRTAKVLSVQGTIPQIRAQRRIIAEVQTEQFWTGVDLLQLEQVRESLRELIRFIEHDASRIYYTNLTDEILSVQENVGEFGSSELQSYRKKVNQYLRENKNHLSIHKLRTNKPLSEEDFLALEQILWHEVGTKEDYEREFGNTPLTVLVLQVVGLDQETANEAFSEFLNDHNLDSRQIRFVKTIVDYVVKNGVIEKKALQEEPFRSIGSIVDVFPEGSARKIVSIIDRLNENAISAAGA
ncbi:MAG TPA: hypothetical protein GXX57_01925 [Firmicutes bacterium]|nr:hypothetical protein [Bacillota bacterium]